eukprot:Blabericola_migrator_1__6460@NODE_325_length_9793_cov_271_773288_g262_i0_p7_GENE_NODE_325_length_9793_cov_271_773288_g262_i0NODE_325_length_9793_cov_271_773288_g262_i0_p7_ORF_typecomplete_len159_score2_11_NODE_325_length_9793_cov_271_773288_g262_i074067882
MAAEGSPDTYFLQVVVEVELLPKVATRLGADNPDTLGRGMEDHRMAVEVVGSIGDNHKEDRNPTCYALTTNDSHWVGRPDGSNAPSSADPCVANQGGTVFLGVDLLATNGVDPGGFRAASGAVPCTASHVNLPSSQGNSYASTCRGLLVDLHVGQVDL